MPLFPEALAFTKFLERLQGRSAPPVSELRRDITLTRLGIGVTLIATLAFLAATGPRGKSGVAGELGRLLFLLIVLFLIYGGLVYQFTRLGYLKRTLRHRRASDGELHAVYRRDATPSLTILVPSYKEEPEIVLKTLLCSALQEYPNRRVVLLIDDPPDPTRSEDVERLASARGSATAVQKLLEDPRQRCELALAASEARRARDPFDTAGELEALAELYHAIGQWFQRQADDHPVLDHTDRVFVELTFRRPARSCLDEARRFAARGARGPLPTEEEITITYQRLCARFRVEVTTFERKRFANLSHDANKAMNLNSYLDLMGRRVRSVSTADGRRLLCGSGPGLPGMDVPDADYVLIVDADSVLDSEYSLRLIHVMEQPGNERLAVVQTPYSAFPGASGLERIAGATTDVQYIIHQGFTYYGGTFWVGANAIVRKRALEDIAVSTLEHGLAIRKFIQDRTVIEDTESSVDLAARGWRLENYPERLAFSATPPDFGALLIQRRRWANGGLLLLPKLLRYVAGRAPHTSAVAEALVRCHYLVSIAAVNVGLLLVLALPLGDRADTLWLPLTALPYYALYTRDLRRVGYRTSDVMRVYALNLLLVPVHLAGVARSLRQAWTGRKSSFGRTPKVKDGTPTPLRYLVVESLLLAQWMIGALIELRYRHHLRAAFGLANAGFLSYALVRFLGLGRHTCLDIVVRGVASLGRVRTVGLTVAVACGGILAFTLSSKGTGYVNLDSLLAESGLFCGLVALPLAVGVVALVVATLPRIVWINLAVLAVLIAALEAGTRIVAAQPPAIRGEPQAVGAPTFYVPEAALGYAMAPLTVAHHRRTVDGVPIYDVVYRTDAWGRRDTPVVAGSARTSFVLFFGDSNTFGEGLSQTETLPYYAGETAPTVRPYNYGVSGYGPSHVLALSRRARIAQEVSEREGHAVVFLIPAHVRRVIGSSRVSTGWGRHFPYVRPDAGGHLDASGDFVHGRPLITLAYFFWNASALTSSMGVELPPRHTTGHYALTARVLAESRRELAQRFQLRGFVAVLGQAYDEPQRQVMSRLGEALAREGVPHLDYTGLFDVTDPAYRLSEFDYHNSALANRLIAQRLVVDLGLAQ